MSDHVLFDEIIVPINDVVTRAGEGGALQLKNGNIFLAYSRYTESREDDAPADIAAMEYNPVENKWIDRGIIIDKKDSRNLMSCSLIRLKDGRIIIVYIEKITSDIDRLMLRFSNDEARTWSYPIRITPQDSANFYVVDNDRLVMTAAGRLLLPVCITEPGKKMVCGVYYSDDLGCSWKLSQTISILPENTIEPPNLTEAHYGFWEDLKAEGVCSQEPGVAELTDGRIMMWCRTNGGYMYKSFSSDKGETWSEFLPDRQIISPLSPQSIKMISGTSRLMCIYNDHRDFEYATEEGLQWGWRTPLSVAVSDDNGESWSIIGNLEGTEYNWCYTSICFFDEKVLFTYYMSDNVIEDGKVKRYHLGSLKAKIVSKNYFLQQGKNI